MPQLDVLFVNPNSLRKSYQKLANSIASIEPPLWSLLYAECCRKAGYDVDILDCSAERLTDKDAVDRIKYLKPRLICFTTGGPNPSSGIANMAGVISLAECIKESGISSPILLTGKYANALPRQTLEDHSYIDFVTINEGFYCLLDLLQTNLKDGLHAVRALGYREGDLVFVNTIPNSIIPQSQLDEIVPGYAWDLLPYNSQPFDLYQTQIWHNNFNSQDRTGYANIFTSLGCAHSCSFCTVNLVNKQELHQTSSDCARVRRWSRAKILSWFDQLADLGVKHLRISDDMFLDYTGHSIPILEELANRSYISQLNMWAYSRIGGFTDKNLELCKRSSVNWLAPGIESSSTASLKQVNKGSYTTEDTHRAIALSKQHDINVMGNYIIGLPDDDISSMVQTYNLMLDLCTEGMNCFPCIALPGSQLYHEAKAKGMELPTTFSGYAFLSEDCVPLPTKHCSKEEVLVYRDSIWFAYMNDSSYHSHIQQKFGQGAVDTIKNLCKTQLKRKILS